MNRGMPSMVALLGLLAVAGYQNRDKLAEMLGGRNQGAPGGAPDKSQAGGGLLGGLLGGAGAGSVLSGGLGDLVDRFRQAGHGQEADSWVGKGANQPLSPEHLEKAVGADVLSTLSERTGLSREELLSRLSRDLPAAVDRFTPEGRLPTEDEAARLV